MEENKIELTCLEDAELLLFGHALILNKDIFHER